MEKIKGKRLFIGIPCRSNKCFIDFASSLAESVAFLISCEVEVCIEKSVNDCFVEVARNHLVNKFMKSDFTHLLMIDDDMSWNNDTICHMLAEDKDFIAAAGPMKMIDDTVRFAVKNYKASKEKVIEVDYIGGAFILLSKNCIHKLIAAYPDHYSKHYEGYGFFKMEVTPEHLITEDFYFCKLWRDLGEKVYCYTDVTFGHLGHKEWNGNYHKLLSECEELKAL